MFMKKVKVVRIDKFEFELEDGRVYKHFMKLNEVPSLEEFQKMYDYWQSVLEVSGESNGNK